jgi:hypothetical protein
MWSSGQGLIHFHGTPPLALVWLFAGGALIAFGVLQLAIRSAGSPDDVQPAAAPTGCAPAQSGPWPSPPR